MKGDKHMKKSKFLALLLVLSMIVGLFCACGSGSSSDTTTSTAAESASSAETVAEEAEEPAEEVPAESATEATAEAASAVEGNGGSVEAETLSDPMEAMAEEFISYPLEGENNTITMWYYIPSYSEYMNSNYDFNTLAAAEEATGVKLDFVEVPASSADTNFSLMIAGGDMCDLIPVLEYYTSGIAKAYEEDVIMDIGDYIDEYMPNYAAVLECLDPATVEDTLTDGHTLAFYQINDGSYSGNGLITRQDWLDEQGITFSGDVISLDEYTNLLETLHSAYNTPYTYYMTDGTMGMDAAFDTSIPVLQGDGFMTSTTSTIFRKGTEVMSGWTTDGYREYLEWLIGLMDEGVIYKDFLSLEIDRGTSNTATGSGQVAVWQANADKIEEILGYTEDPNFAVTAIPRISSDPDSQYVWNDAVDLVSTRGGFSLSSTCENPELVCQWENFFWTTEGYYLVNYGEEGESYHMDGDTPVFDWENPVTVTGKNAPNAEMAQTLFTMVRFAGGYLDNDRLLPTFPDTALAAVELWTIDGSTDDRNYPSAITFTPEESDEIAQYEGDFLTYAAETCLKFLDGATELNDDTWNDFVSTCESMGLDKIVAVYQNAYDQYLAGER
jgi:putative aldouronate transport system substrate-binding protein